MNARLAEAAATVQICDELEVRMVKQNQAMAHLENTLRGEHHFHHRIHELESALSDKSAKLESMKMKLASGKPVAMPPQAKREVSAAIEASLKGFALRGKTTTTVKKASAAHESNQNPDGLSIEEMMAMEAADQAAMPGWSLDAWLSSLHLDELISVSISSHVQKAGHRANPQVNCCRCFGAVSLYISHVLLILTLLARIIRRL